MPFGDGTGPMGFGPMTGRAAGYCVGYGVPGYMNPIPGRGFWGWGRGGGRGWRDRGGGRGWRHWYYATGLPGWARGGWGRPAWGATPYGSYGVPFAGAVAPSDVPYYGPQVTREQEMDTLKGQAEYFEDALEGIRKRLAELEAAQQQK